MDCHVRSNVAVGRHAVSAGSPPSPLHAPTRRLGPREAGWAAGAAAAQPRSGAPPPPLEAPPPRSAKRSRHRTRGPPTQPLVPCRDMREQGRATPRRPWPPGGGAALDHDRRAPCRAGLHRAPPPRGPPPSPLCPAVRRSPLLLRALPLRRVAGAPLLHHAHLRLRRAARAARGRDLGAPAARALGHGGRDLALGLREEEVVRRAATTHGRRSGAPPGQRARAPPRPTRGPEEELGREERGGEEDGGVEG